MNIFPPSRGERSEQGFVLVTVLTGILLLLAIAMTFTYTSRLETKIRSTHNHSVEARLLADGVVRATASRLVDRDVLSRWQKLVASEDGFICSDGAYNVTIRIVDTGGLIDLNSAPKVLFERLIKGVTQSDQLASQLASAIDDFRLPNLFPERAGLPYRAAGLPHGPKNAPFDTISELDQVIGMFPGLYQRLRSSLTVHSRLPGIDPDVAPRELLALLRGPDSYLPPELIARTTSTSFVISALVESIDGGRFHREAVMEFTPGAANEFMFREWSRVLLEQSAPVRQRKSISQCNQLLR
jgi:general secretion pathway protein K